MNAAAEATAARDKTVRFENMVFLVASDWWLFAFVSSTNYDIAQEQVLSLQRRKS